MLDPQPFRSTRLFLDRPRDECLYTNVGKWTGTNPYRLIHCYIVRCFMVHVGLQSVHIQSGPSR